MSLNEITMWLLGEYVADDPEDFESLYNDSMELIRGSAVEKNIEFDDYYLSRWKTAADNILNFDEKYFSDNEKEIYMYFFQLRLTRTSIIILNIYGISFMMKN